MDVKEFLIDEIVKNGYSPEGTGKIWDLSKRDLLYLTKEQADAFLKLREHPRYKQIIIDKEISLMKENSKSIIEKLKSSPFNLIDVGCGDGIKAVEFLKILDGKADSRYIALNLNDGLMDLALKGVKTSKLKSVKEFKKRLARFDEIDEAISESRCKDYQRNVVLMLGSIIASFEINDYLFHLSQAMFKGDVLVLGNGIRKGERFVGLETYKHPVFSSWFIHLMRELGFKDSEVEYDARFANNRVEGFYKIKIDKEISHKGKKLSFKKGDEIVVAILYKFFEKELEEFCKMYFSEVKLLKDSEEEYALIFCKK